MDVFGVVIFISMLLVLSIVNPPFRKLGNDRTWNAFSRMVTCYEADLALALVAILPWKNIVIKLLCFYVAFVFGIMGIRRFHSYVLCFCTEKYGLKVPIHDRFVHVEEGLLIAALTMTYVAGVISPQMDTTALRSTIWIILFGLIMPDALYVYRNIGTIKKRDAVIWIIHSVVFFVATVMDSEHFSYAGQPVIVFTILFIYLSINTQTINESQLVTAEIKKKRTELMKVQEKVMISQIQPHFMYNVLNIISILCRRSPEKAAETTRTFARYLRMNTDSLKKDKPVPFNEELAHAETYLSLEKVRFGEDLQISYDIASRNFRIPVLSLQPMVENAVKHGLCMKEDGDGHLSVSTREDENNWYVIVSDDGVGFDTGAPRPVDERGHIGVENTRLRVEAMCRGTLEIHSIPGTGTNVVMSIPKSWGPNHIEEEHHDRKGAML